MRPLRIALLVLFLSTFATTAFAQTGRIVFDETEHAFGDVEEGEQARHVFTFRNAGDAPLRLKDVRPSCGCTTPEWTQDAIAPGGTGTITVAYHSAGRPGGFEKSINVVTDGEPSLVVLYIGGNVVTTALADTYRQGSLRVDQETIDLGPVPADENGRHVVRVQNAGERPVRFTKVAHAPENVRVELPATPLFAGDVAEITLVVMTDAVPAGTAFDYAVALETTDAEQPVKLFRVKGRVAAGSTP